MTTRLYFWLTVCALIYLGVVFWITDRQACVSSQTVTVGETAVVNEVTCL